MGLVYVRNEELAECKAKAFELTDNKERMKTRKKCNKTFGGKRNAKKYGGIKAQDSNCCAWTNAGCLIAKKALVRNNIDPEFCGLIGMGKNRAEHRGINQEIACCFSESKESYGDCDNAGNP